MSATLSRAIQIAEDALNALRRKHWECEDCWYSCPKADGCRTGTGPECDCGADRDNRTIDEALEKLGRLKVHI